MLGLDLKASAIAGLFGVIIGGAACMAAHVSWLDPSLVKATTKTVTDQVTATVTAERNEACLQVTAEAERQARKLADERRFAAIDQALLAYQQAARNSAAESATQIANLESEIRSYEARLEEMGRRCPTTADDYRFIYGDRVQLPQSEAGQ